MFSLCRILPILILFSKKIKRLTNSLLSDCKSPATWSHNFRRYTIYRDVTRKLILNTTVLFKSCIEPWSVYGWLAVQKNWSSAEDNISYDRINAFNWGTNWKCVVKTCNAISDHSFMSLTFILSEVEKFVTANTQELAKDKWLCPLSGKKFKGPEFVRKHIFTKHNEKIEEVKKEVRCNGILIKERPHLINERLLAKWISTVQILSWALRLVNSNSWPFWAGFFSEFFQW